MSPSQSPLAIKFPSGSVFYAIALRNHYLSATKLTMNKDLGELALKRQTQNSFDNDRATISL